MSFCLIKFGSNIGQVYCLLEMDRLTNYPIDHEKANFC